MKKIFLIVAVLSTLVLTPSFGKDRDENREKRNMTMTEAMQKVSESASTRDFTIYAYQAITQLGRVITITDPYYITIKGNQLICRLPYIGRFYDRFIQNQGLTFDSTIKNFAVFQGERNSMIVMFNTKTDYDSYRFRIEIETDGTTYINIWPTNKESMSFTGELSTSWRDQ